jgi:hypothetical protein
MRQHPPTDLQLYRLRQLEYHGPPPADRLAASDIIEGLLQRGENT